MKNNYRDPDGDEPRLPYNAETPAVVGPVITINVEKRPVVSEEAILKALLYAPPFETN